MKARSTLALLVVAVVVAVGAQGATAAERPSLADDVAARLGIPAERLREAVRAALMARIDAAVASGKLSLERAARLKERLANTHGLGLRPLRGFGHRDGGFAGRLGAKARGLGSVADYLDMTRDELRAELREGKSLAQIASANGKTAAGLVATMLAPAKERLADAVADGRLTRARADALLDRLEERLDELVQRAFPPKP